MAENERVVCNHNGLEQGAHIIHADGCNGVPILRETPKVVRPVPVGKKLEEISSGGRPPVSTGT